MNPIWTALLLMLFKMAWSQCPRNCEHCSTPQICTSCMSGFTPVQQGCAMQNSCLQPTCTSCQENMCTKCMDGYSLILSQCLPCSPNCLQCETEQICSSCMQGFYLDGGGCEPCSSNCLFCDNGTVCLNCSKGYFRDQGVCVQCLYGCSLCESTQNCTECKQSFFPDSNYTECTQCDYGCLHCEDSQNCTSCIDGMILSQGFCTVCRWVIQYCSQCQENQTDLYCSQCDDGFYLGENGSCVACQIGCFSCNQSTCFECDSGLYIDSGHCRACLVDQCQKCVQFQCIGCRRGFYISKQSDKCFPCALGCSICLSETQCMSCQENFFEIGGKCIPCAFSCTGCQNSAFNCSGCLDGFYQANGYGQCLACPWNCSTCTSPISCQSCNQGFYPLNSTCTPCSAPNCLYCSATDECQACQQTFYFSKNGTCLPCDPLCQICNSTSCSQCIIGYYLSKGQCVSCGIDNCLSCVSIFGKMTCTLCMQMTTLIKIQNPDGSSGYTCTKCPQFCLYCSSPTLCRQCLPTHIPTKISNTQWQCELCPHPCATCQIQPNNCLTCVNGYRMAAMYTCLPCPEGCSICDQMGCLQCQQFYTIQAVVPIGEIVNCLPCGQNCLKCQVDANRTNATTCVSCQSGALLLSSGVCFVCGSTNATHGCLVCDGEICLECGEGLLLGLNGCSAKPIKSNPKISEAVWITVIVILSIICVVLAGCLVHGFVAKKKRQGIYASMT